MHQNEVFVSEAQRGRTLGSKVSVHVFQSCICRAPWVVRVRALFCVRKRGLSQDGERTNIAAFAIITLVVIVRA